MTHVPKPVTIAVILIFAWSCMAGHASAQELKKSGNWYFGPRIGLVSFFGDLSVHDFNPVRKLNDETDFAWGFMAGKEVSREFSANAYFTHGGMKGSNPELDMYFNNTFSELNLGITASITRLIRPKTNAHFDFYAGIAGGMIQYRSIKYRLSDGSYLSSEGYTEERKNSGKPESSFIIPVGIGLSYRTGAHLIMAADFAFRLHNKDLLDSQVGSTGISDRYSFLSLGMYYILSPVVNRKFKSIECPGDFRHRSKQNSRAISKFGK